MVKSYDRNTRHFPIEAICSRCGSKKLRQLSYGQSGRMVLYTVLCLQYDNVFTIGARVDMIDL